MSSEHSLKTVVAFDKLPSTPEKDEIKRQYLHDEIGAFEFYQKASAYIDKQSEVNRQ